MPCFSSRRLTVRTLVALGMTVACREVPTAANDPVSPSFKPAPSPSYATLTPPVAPGWTAFSPVDINGLHQAIGVMNPVGSSSPRAAVWMAGTTAVPVALPIPDGQTASGAAGISENGIVAGRIGSTAVLWLPTQSGWQIQQLAEDGDANDVRNDGVAVGTMRDPLWPSSYPPMPVIWDPAGTPDTLPLPASGTWNGGEAIAINAQGDVAGSVRIWKLGMSTIYGALWIRDGSTYTPVVLQSGWSRGLSDRTSDGRIHVTASGVHDSYRHTFTPAASGGWTHDSVYVGGTAEDMNPSGNFVGTIQKGPYSSDGYPFLYTASGTLIKLPLPKNVNGGANGISNDGWITGVISGTGVVWKP